MNLDVLVRFYFQNPQKIATKMKVSTCPSGCRINSWRAIINSKILAMLASELFSSGMYLFRIDYVVKQLYSIFVM